MIQVGGIRGVGEYRAENGSDTWSPPGGECHADKDSAGVTDRLFRDMDSALAPECPDVEHPEQVQAEHNDQQTACAADPFAAKEEESPDYTGRSAQRKKYNCESGDEQQRMNKGDPPRLFDIFQAQSRNKAYVTRNQRQNTGREKTQDTRSKADHQTNGSWLHVQESRARSIAAVKAGSFGEMGPVFLQRSTPFLSIRKVAGTPTARNLVEILSSGSRQTGNVIS